MNLHPILRKSVVLALFGLPILGLIAGGGHAPSARAEVPAGDPFFSEPTEIDNAFHPISPGAVKVYKGREDGQTVTIVETHLPETREFEWNGGFVECRTVREFKFENGTLLETELSWFAQSTDGTVWIFGEAEYEAAAADDDDDDDGDDDDDDEDEKSGWVVGPRAPSDPPDMSENNAPRIFMPANPELGDTWRPEEFEGKLKFADDTVRGIDVRARTPAGRFGSCVRIFEVSEEGDSESKWFAPGTGLIKVKGKNERLKLQATSLVPGMP